MRRSIVGLGGEELSTAGAVGAHAAISAANFGSTGLAAPLPHLIAELRALVDPRTQHADLLAVSGPRRRHLHAAVAVDKSSNQFASALLPGMITGP